MVNTKVGEITMEVDVKKIDLVGLLYLKTQRAHNLLVIKLKVQNPHDLSPGHMAFISNFVIKLKRFTCSHPPNMNLYVRSKCQHRKCPGASGGPSISKWKMAMLIFQLCYL